MDDSIIENVNHTTLAMAVVVAAALVAGIYSTSTQAAFAHYHGGHIKISQNNKLKLNCDFEVLIESDAACKQSASNSLD